MSGTLSGTEYVNVKSGKTLRYHSVGPIPISGTSNSEQEALEVQFDARVIGTKVYSGGFVYLHSGAVASFTNVISGGEQEVFQGGKALHTALSGATTARAMQEVYGVARDTIVYTGGLSYAASGGVISDSIVEAGGVEYAFAGGKIVGATVSAGGVEGGAGTLVSITVSNGGSAYVSAFGMASGSVIHAGGREVICKDSTEKNTVIAGGRLVLNEGAKTEGTITFDGAGSELEVRAGKMPKAVLTDFVAGDEVKLAGVKYSKADTVTVVSAGVVVITAGTKDYTLDIAGAQAGDSSAFHFGSGGILTTTAPAMAFLPPAAAAVEPASLQAAPKPGAPKPAIAMTPPEAGWVSSATMGLLASDDWLGGKPMGYALLSGYGGSF